MMPIMIAFDLTRLNTLPDGEDSTGAPSRAIQTLSQSGTRVSPAWFPFSYPLPKSCQPTSRQKLPPTLMQHVANQSP
jgi:hypothetical protein